jgi:hypothetical protein
LLIGEQFIIRLIRMKLPCTGGKLRDRCFDLADVLKLCGAGPIGDDRDSILRLERFFSTEK